MFIYLAKKISIAIPDPVELHAISWNAEKRWIAVSVSRGVAWPAGTGKP